MILNIYWMFPCRLHITLIPKDSLILSQQYTISRSTRPTVLPRTQIMDKEQNRRKKHTHTSISMFLYHFSLKSKLLEFKRPTLMIGNIFSLELTAYYICLWRILFVTKRDGNDETIFGSALFVKWEQSIKYDIIAACNWFLINCRFVGVARWFALCFCRVCLFLSFFLKCVLVVSVWEQQTKRERKTQDE